MPSMKKFFRFRRTSAIGDETSSSHTQTRVIDSFIVRLRRYIEPNPAHPKHIVSVRGHGYRLNR